MSGLHRALQRVQYVLQFYAKRAHRRVSPHAAQLKFGFALQLIQALSEVRIAAELPHRLSARGKADYRLSVESVLQNVTAFLVASRSTRSLNATGNEDRSVNVSEIASTTSADDTESAVLAQMTTAELLELMSNMLILTEAPLRSKFTLAWLNLFAERVSLVSSSQVIRTIEILALLMKRHKGNREAPVVSAVRSQAPMWLKVVQERLQHLDNAQSMELLLAISQLQKESLIDCRTLVNASVALISERAPTLEPCLVLSIGQSMNRAQVSRRITGSSSRFGYAALQQFWLRWSQRAMELDVLRQMSASDLIALVRVCSSTPSYIRQPAIRHWYDEIENRLNHFTSEDLIAFLRVHIDLECTKGLRAGVHDERDPFFDRTAMLIAHRIDVKGGDVDDKDLATTNFRNEGSDGSANISARIVATALYCKGVMNRLRPRNDSVGAQALQLACEKLIVFDAARMTLTPVKASSLFLGLKLCDEFGNRRASAPALIAALERCADCGSSENMWDTIAIGTTISALGHILRPRPTLDNRDERVMRSTAFQNFLKVWDRATLYWVDWLLPDQIVAALLGLQSLGKRPSHDLTRALGIKLQRSLTRFSGKELCHLVYALSLSAAASRAIVTSRAAQEAIDIVCEMHAARFGTRELCLLLFSVAQGLQFRAHPVRPALFSKLLLRTQQLLGQMDCNDLVMSMYGLTQLAAASASFRVEVRRSVLVRNWCHRLLSLKNMDNLIPLGLKRVLAIFQAHNVDVPDELARSWCSAFSRRMSSLNLAHTITTLSMLREMNMLPTGVLTAVDWRLKRSILNLGIEACVEALLFHETLQTRTMLRYGLRKSVSALQCRIASIASRAPSIHIDPHGLQQLSLLLRVDLALSRMLDDIPEFSVRLLETAVQSAHDHSLTCAKVPERFTTRQQPVFDDETLVAFERCAGMKTAKAVPGYPVWNAVGGCDVHAVMRLQQTQLSKAVLVAYVLESSDVISAMMGSASRLKHSESPVELALRAAAYPHQLRSLRGSTLLRYRALTSRADERHNASENIHHADDSPSSPRSIDDRGISGMKYDAVVSLESVAWSMVARGNARAKLLVDLTLQALQKSDKICAIYDKSHHGHGTR